MAKAVILRYLDIDPGADDNNVTLLAEIRYVGSGVPGGVANDLGPNGNGVAIPWNITSTATQFSNAVENALIARAATQGITLVATDVLFPSYTRGS